MLLANEHKDMYCLAFTVISTGHKEKKIIGHQQNESKK